MILATKGYHSLGSNSELQITIDIYANFSCSPSEGIINLPNFPKGLQVFWNLAIQIASLTGWLEGSFPVKMA